MAMFFFAIIVFFSSHLWPTPLKVIVSEPSLSKSYSFQVDDDEKSLSIADLHRSFLLQKKIRSAIKGDKEVSFDTKRINIDGQTIIRSTPQIDGLLVEGADGIFNGNDYLNQFHYTNFELPSAEFRLSPAEAMERAISYHRMSLLKDPYVEKTKGIYEKLWLMHISELRPVFKVRLPTLSIFDLKDIYVDAENGDILQIEDAAQFVTAPSKLFVYSPLSGYLNKNDLHHASLPNLIDLKEDEFLHGEYVSVRNCCKYFTCPQEGECTDDKKKCALKSHSNAQQTRELLSLPTETLGLDPLMSLPEFISVDAIRCTNLPFARANTDNGSGKLGFFEEPIDEPGEASEMDRFSEIQAYFSVMSFFNNIRYLLNDNTWCLRETAMSCNSDGTPAKDEKGHPINPYKIFVNQLIPDMKLDGTNQSSNESFLSQVLGGRGSRDNPIKLDRLTRIGNAAFVPALSTLKTKPRADEILSDLIKPFDHNVFFQGDRDFAYDGDVVFHEFMHAITTSLINKINSLGLDEWGINSEPGGLNEAWSDYFAGAFNDDPAIGKYASIRGGYGEVAMRHIDNNANCPNDVIGEIHNDGLIWSGALWEIRTKLQKNYGAQAATLFDRAVLASLSEAKTTEDFKTQSEKVINNLRNRDGLGESAAAIADEVFKSRGIKNCFRAFTLSSVDEKNRLNARVKNLLFVASKNQIGLLNYAPATSQLEVGIPAGALGMTLSWRQYLGGTGALLGTEATPDTTKNIVPLDILPSLDIPISWKFKGKLAIPMRLGLEVTDPPQPATYQNGHWQVYLPLNFEKCDQKTMYLSILSNDFKYVLENLTVKFDIDQSKDLSQCDFKGTLRGDMEELAQSEDELLGCSTYGLSHGYFALGLLILFLLKKRSRQVFTEQRQLHQRQLET